MCCFFTVLVFIGPRAAILVWWLIDTDRWEIAFDNFIWAILGFIFVPWTTMMWARSRSGRRHRIRLLLAGPRDLRRRPLLSGRADTGEGGSGYYTTTA